MGRAATAVGLMLFGLWLALASLAQTQTQVLQNEQPSAALAWNPRNPQALTRLAEMYADARTDARDSTMAITLARSALRLAPLDGVALRVLGVEALRNGEAQAAARLMAMSDILTQRDSVAQLWLLEQAIGRGDYELAFTKAEVVLRREPWAQDQVFPVMRLAMRDDRAYPALVRRLEARPPWREAFLADAFAHSDQLDQARRLFTSLAQSSAPPTAGEGEGLIKRLVADHAYQDAYSIWRRLLSLPPGATTKGLYAGDFRPRPGSAPFNWDLSEAADAFAELGQSPDGAPALHAQFRTGANAQLASQLLMIPPGAYQLRGRVRSDGYSAPRLAAWTVSCAEGGSLLAESAVAPSPASGWADFSANFVVPAGNCESQVLKLQSFAQDRFETTEAWYRDLQLVPLASPAPVEERVLRDAP